MHQEYNLSRAVRHLRQKHAEVLPEYKDAISELENGELTSVVVFSKSALDIERQAKRSPGVSTTIEVRVDRAPLQ